MKYTVALPPPRVDWFRDKMRVPVIRHDFTTVYRQLQKIGFSQVRIGEYTNQSQPEVSAIINGRKILVYKVIKRIVTGLGIPACLAGVGDCCHDECGINHTGPQPVTPSATRPPATSSPAIVLPNQPATTGQLAQLWVPTSHVHAPPRRRHRHGAPPSREAFAVFDRVARREMGISGEEFLHRWDAGEWHGIDLDDVPGLPDVWMRLPLVRQGT